MSDVRPGDECGGSGSYTETEFHRFLEARMAQPVYKLWQGRFTEAWHQLPQQEQQRLLSLVMEALNTAGGKELVMCSAAWSNERWPFFGVEEFPDLEAEQRHEQILTDLNWARYIESRTTLGTELILPQ
jgi:hypothetical protein